LQVRGLPLKNTTRKEVMQLVDHTHRGATTQAPDVTFLTPRDIQRELRIGERLTYKLLRAGAIPSIRVAGMYRVRREDLEAAVKRGTTLEARQ
jgi:excisionase family DNA binding protein